MGKIGVLFHRAGARYVWTVALAALCGCAVLAISMSESGGASFPGTNGRIAFSNGQSYASQSIYSVQADGSALLGLTSGTNDYWPSYSPDGTKIALNRNNSIVVMNADGTGQAQIATGTKSENTTTEWESNYKDPHGSKESPKIIPEVKIVTRTRVGKSFYGPEFFAGGSQVAVSEAAFNRTQIEVCAVEKDGDTECLDYEEPGAYFNYESDCINCFQHIVTLNATTGALASVITPAAADVTDFSPAVSADGKIAFTRYGGTAGGSGIFLVASPGAPPVQLTGGFGNYSPDFSPDSSKLVFSHEGKSFGVIGVGGGPITLITLPPGPPKSFEYVELPRFSPDGTQIAFFRSRFTPPSTEENGIFVMASNGANPHRITEGYDPTWQPVPPPPPIPATGSKKHKGKLKLNKKGQAVIGTITCGSSPCSLKVSSALLSVKQASSNSDGKGGKSSAAASKRKTRAKKYGMKATAPKTLAPGAKGKVTITVKGKALEALRKAHKGDASVKLQVTEALGAKTLTLSATLAPPKAEKKKSKGKGKKKGH